MIPETKVKLDGGVTEGTFMTSNDGDYRFEGLEKFNDYTLLPEKDNNYLSGVSTLDLVLMQRHILGVEDLIPHKLIAADVNRSNSISVSDLFRITKVDSWYSKRSFQTTLLGDLSMHPISLKTKQTLELCTIHGIFRLVTIDVQFRLYWDENWRCQQ